MNASRKTAQRLTVGHGASSKPMRKTRYCDKSTCTKAVTRSATQLLIREANLAASLTNPWTLATPTCLNQVKMNSTELGEMANHSSPIHQCKARTVPNIRYFLVDGGYPTPTGLLRNPCFTSFEQPKLTSQSRRLASPGSGSRFVPAVTSVTSTEAICQDDAILSGQSEKC